MDPALASLWVQVADLHVGVPGVEAVKLQRRTPVQLRGFPAELEVGVLLGCEVLAELPRLGRNAAGLAAGCHQAIKVVRGIEVVVQRRLPGQERVFLIALVRCITPGGVGIAIGSEYNRSEWIYRDLLYSEPMAIPTPPR